MAIMMEKTETIAGRCVTIGNKTFPGLEKSGQRFKTFFYTVGLCYKSSVIKVGTKQYILQKGSVLTIGPGITCRWIDGGPLSMDMLFFYEDLFLNTFNHTFFYSLEFFCPDAQNKMVLDSNGFEEMKHLFDAVHLLKSKPDVVSGIVFSILKLAQKQYWKQHCQNKKDLSLKERITADFRHLLSKHFAEHKDVSFYASALHISAKYLTEVLLATTGMSAKKWIDHHLMQEAKYLLVDKGLSVKEVSFSLGYVDASHFIKSFKKHEGELPSDFKQKAMNALLS